MTLTNETIQASSPLKRSALFHLPVRCGTIRILSPVEADTRKAVRNLGSELQLAGVKRRHAELGRAFAAVCLNRHGASVVVGNGRQHELPTPQHREMVVPRGAAVQDAAVAVDEVPNLRISAASLEHQSRIPVASADGRVMFKVMPVPQLAHVGLRDLSRRPLPASEQEAPDEQERRNQLVPLRSDMQSHDTSGERDEVLDTVVPHAHDRSGTGASPRAAQTIATQRHAPTTSTHKCRPTASTSIGRRLRYSTQAQNDTTKSTSPCCSQHRTSATASNKARAGVPTLNYRTRPPYGVTTQEPALLRYTSQKLSP